jgi:hypothetical protein
MTAAPVGISAVANVGTASVTDNNDNKWKFEGVEGEERHEVINRFTSNSEVSILLQYARKQSWSPNLDESQVIKTTSLNVTKYSVISSFQNNSTGSNISDENIFIAWESSDDLDTTLYRFSESSIDSSSEIHQTLYGVDESGLVTHTKKRSSDMLVDSKSARSIETVNHELIDDGGGGGGGSGSDCYKLCPAVVCDPYNLECIAQLIFAGIVALGSCLGCGTIDITKSSCLVCLGSLGLTGTSPFTCPLGDNCRSEYKCVNRNQFVRGRGGSRACI